MATQSIIHDDCQYHNISQTLLFHLSLDSDISIIQLLYRKRLHATNNTFIKCAPLLHLFSYYQFFTICNSSNLFIVNMCSLCLVITGVLLLLLLAAYSLPSARCCVTISITYSWTNKKSKNALDIASISCKSAFDLCKCASQITRYSNKSPLVFTPKPAPTRERMRRAIEVIIWIQTDIRLMCNYLDMARIIT